jgi:hypothetical protein
MQRTHHIKNLFNKYDIHARYSFIINAATYYLQFTLELVDCFIVIIKTRYLLFLCFFIFCKNA